MATSRQIRRLATNPADYVRFMGSGKLPEGVRPASPLIDLLERIAPRDRLAMAGMTIGAELGYAGSRQFANAEQALRWIKPAEEVFDGFPAEGWRIKHFAGPVYLDDVVAHCARVPEQLFTQYPRLRRPGVSRDRAGSDEQAPDSFPRPRG